MFEQMKAMGALAGLMRDKEKLRAMGEELQRRLSTITVVGSSGGGAVRVTATGKLRVESVELEPAMLAGEGESSRELAEGLIAEATNDALAKAMSAAQAEFARFSEEHELPAIPGVERMLGAG